ncbi:MAG: hypothetical protein M1813_007657 [Trichoglossum hirsutum]|nr:MAG: hypothetical protein M1813_007657 [Trichoglossum hirsutum]
MSTVHYSSQSVAVLLPKLHDLDSDYRFMSLNDLHNVLSVGPPSLLLNDYNTSSRTVDGILKTLDDQNGEVQNLAVKCLAPLVLKLPPSILPGLIEKLSTLTTTNSIDNSIPATALRTVVSNLPRATMGVPPSKATQEAYSAISKVLIPRLIGYIVIPLGIKGLPEPPRGMLEPDPQKGTDVDAVDVAIEVVRCFGPMLQEAEVRALQTVIMAVLENNRTGSVVKKRAVVAISLLAVYSKDELLSSFVSQLTGSFGNVHLAYDKRRLLITIVGSLARSIPQRFGPYLQSLAPFVLSPIGEREFQQDGDVDEDREQDPRVDEVREAALVALEGFLGSCSDVMRPFTDESIEAALRFVKYDPNYALDEDEDMEEMQSEDDEGGETNGFDEEEADFEEEGGYSDEDDISWKLRRCAAKVLFTVISTRARGDLLEDGTLYDRVAPVLVDRFKEREENVRLEILATTSALIRKTGEGVTITDTAVIDDSHAGIMAPPQGRKRRRGGSDASMFDTQAAISLSAGLTSPVAPPPPTSGPRASLADLTPTILRAVAKLLRGNSVPTKQAAIILLKDIVEVQHGGLSEHLNQIMDPVVDAVKSSSGSSGGVAGTATTGGAASATGSSLRIEALILLDKIAESHPSSVMEPYLAKLVPAVVTAVGDRFYKISSEALCTAEQVVKVITPPRSLQTYQHQVSYLEELYNVIVDRITANDADLEVRERAIHALGVLVGRTSGPEGAKLLPAAKRFSALDVLYDRLRNETTRLAAVRAIDTVATLATTKDEFSPEWVRDVSIELGAQLRKVNRSLRGASLGALKNLVVNPAGHSSLDKISINELINLLTPLLTINDLHLLGPALVVLANLIEGDAKKALDKDMVASLCSLALAPLGGAVLDALLILVKTIGEQGVGKLLMQGLLRDVGVSGDPAVVGKVIGVLLVYGGSTIGVQIGDFVNELQTAQDDQRRCLALSILGEAGLRMGQSSPLEPALFLAQFASKSDQVPLAAAISLGRAGSGNVGKYLPVILKTMDKGGNAQYLLLHSIKEILQHASSAEIDIAPYTKQIWGKLLSASQTEDNRAVGAECVGRLTVIDPKTFLPALRKFLSDPDPAVRGMAISATRYTFADTDDSYDDLLKPVIVNMLITMLNDSELENRRLALTTLNSAAHNKPGLILPHLGQLTPLVIKESKIKPELIREVQMGPFRHKVDDGLEVRKSAYETLYALMETAFSRVDIATLYDRVIAGLEDEHDIRILCNLMLTKLIILDPAETQRRLDFISQRFRTILSFKPKEGAVKQELEKAEEASTGVLKVSLQLNNGFPAADAAEWVSYREWIRKNYSLQLKMLEDEGSHKGD